MKKGRSLFMGYGFLPSAVLSRDAHVWEIPPTPRSFASMGNAYFLLLLPVLLPVELLTFCQNPPSSFANLQEEVSYNYSRKFLFHTHCRFLAVVDYRGFPRSLPDSRKARHQK
jgi:hypothetical protein